MKKFEIRLLAVISQLFLIHAVWANGYFLVDTGYRYDRIDELNTITDTTDPTFFLSSNQNFHNLQSYALGAKGAWYVPCTSCFIQGSGHYNWILDGNYSFNMDVTANTTGHSWDTTAGLGYFFPLCKGFSIAPLIGFSYDLQYLKIKDYSAYVPTAGLEILNGSQWTSTWYGPWIGFNLYFETARCIPITFDAGYEYHYGWAHTHLNPPSNDPVNSNYAYTTNLKNMNGHVFHFCALHSFYDNWVCGLKLQYSLWDNHQTARSDIPPPAETGLTSTQNQDIPFLTWHSFSATFNLGFSF